MKKIISTTIAISAILFSVNTFSQTNENVLIGNPNTGKGNVVQIGVPSGMGNQLKGFAKDMHLIDVLKQLVPTGWVVKKVDGDAPLDTQMVVSWKGGKNWVETLASLSENYELYMAINWNKREIKISNQTLESENNIVNNGGFINSGNVFELEGSANLKGSRGFNFGGSPANYVFVMDSKLSLKENVEKWGKSAGYSVVWSGEDYLVEDRVLSGDFANEEGPVKQLSVDYGPKSKVRVPLSFQFFENNTLVVENHTFEQSGYPRFLPNNQ